MQKYINDPINKLIWQLFIFRRNSNSKHATLEIKLYFPNFPLLLLLLQKTISSVERDRKKSMIPRYIGTAASIEALTSIRSLSVEEAEAQLLEPVLDDDNVEAVGDEAELVALADDTPGTPSEASGGARYWSVLILSYFCWFFSLSCMVFFVSWFYLVEFHFYLDPRCTVLHLPYLHIVTTQYPVLTRLF